MRELEIIISDVNQYLIDRSESNNSDYQSRFDHFAQFKKLFEKNNYNELVNHINKGILEFGKFAFFTQRYYHFLLELKKIFVVENNTEKNNRQKKLIQAILSDDGHIIQQSLNQGGYAVFSTKYLDTDISYPQFDNQSLLSIAIASGKQKAVEFFLEKISLKEFNQVLLEDAVQEYLTQTKNPNIILNSQTQYTLLHYFAEFGLVDYLEGLIETGNIDVDVQNKDGSTPLLFACSKNHTDIALKLIEAGANTNLCMQHGKIKYSALYFAINNNNLPLAEKLIEHGATPDENAILLLNKKYYKNTVKYKAMHRLFKKPYRENKEAIIFNKPVKVLFFQPTNPTLDGIQHDSKLLANVLMTQIYAQNVFIKEVIIDNLEAHCKDDSDTENIIKPLLIIVGMGTLGLRGDAKNQKPIKAIINNQDNIANLALGENKNTAGCFNSKNSVFVAGKILVHILATLFHEWKHHVDKEVFGKTRQCFDPKTQQDFDAVKAELYHNFHTFPEGDSKNSLLLHIKNSFYSVIYNDNYCKEIKIEEILTRVPEVIAYLGLKEGTLWLKTHTPKLYDFYKNVYNPLLKDYIRKRHTQAIAEITEKLSAAPQQNYWV